MSCLVIGIGPDAILAACDGVCYEYETGVVAGIVSKIILLPEYDALIGWTGAGAFGAALRWEINQRIGNFDGLVEKFDQLCEDVHWKMFEYHGGPEAEVSCVIAGWSEARQAYEGYRLVSYDKPSMDLSDGRSIRLEPFKATPLPGALWCSYMPKRAGEFGVNPPVEGEGMIEMAIRLICAARADSGWREESNGDSRFYAAGGFIQMAVVERNHTRSWVAHRWPEDVIGQPIDPTKGSPLPSGLEMQNVTSPEA